MTKKKTFAETMRIDLDAGDSIPAAPSSKKIVLKKKRATPRAPSSDPDFQVLFQGLYDATLITDMDGRIEQANNRAARLLGRNVDELVAKTIFDVIASSDQSLLGLLKLNLSEDRFTLLDSHCCKKDGTCFPAEIAVYKLQLDRQYLCFYIRDVSYHKHVEHELEKTRDELDARVEQRTRELQESEKRFRQLFEESNDGIVIHDTAGKVIDLNRKACTMLGRSREGACGCYLNDFYAPAEQQAGEDRLAELRETGSFRFISCLQCPDNALLNVEISGSLIDRDKQLVQSIIRDITEQQSAHEALRQAKEAAEQANYYKSRFLENVSHDIRTPLNGIIGFSEGILSCGSLEEVHEQARIILNESESLHQLIDELLDHAKIESGKLKIENAPLDLHDLLNQIIRTSQILVQDKQIAMHLDMTEDVPRYVYGDTLRLRQILTNLINNAVKFTEKGSIVLAVRCVGMREGRAELELAVTDTGIGIPKERLAAIFQRFTQAECSTGRKYGGTGLGVAIARQLVRLMGGEMGVQSKLGEGSRFWFTLTLSPANAQSMEVKDAEADATTEADMQKVTARILVVDDYPPNQEVARLHLESAGHTVDLAGNGHAAVTACQRQSYDVVLMDVQMPEMDGFEATQAIRRAGMDLPVVGMTANADRSTRERCLVAGMDDVIAKPIRRVPFLRIIHRLLQCCAVRMDTQDEKPAVTAWLDFDALLPACQDSPEWMCRVCGRFAVYLQQAVMQLERARQAGDTDKMTSEIQRMKEAAVRFYATPLNQLLSGCDPAVLLRDDEVWSGLLRELSTGIKTVEAGARVPAGPAP